MNVSKDVVQTGINKTKATSGFLIVILLLSMHNFGALIGEGSIYSWMVIALQLFALMFAVVAIGSVYVPHGSTFDIWLVALFVLAHVIVSDLSFTNIYYVYVIYLSPLVIYLLINVSSRKDILFAFGGLSQILAIANFIPSMLFKEGLGYSGLLLTSSMFGMVSSVFAYVALVKLYYRTTLLNSVFLLLWVIILFQTKHRAGILALILALAVFFLASYKKHVLVKVFIILMGVLLASIIMVIILQYSNLAIVSKMFHGGVVSIENINFSGRLLVWASLIDGYLSNNWVQQAFGNGIGSSTVFLAENHGDTIESISVAHNEFIRLLFEYGVLGLALYLLIIYNIFSFRTSFTIGLPIFVHYSVEMMFSNVFFSAPFYLLMLIMSKWYISEIELQSRELVFVTRRKA